MKQSVKTIVDSIEKEIQFLIDFWDCYENDTERDFLYGSLNFDLSANRKPNPYAAPWESIEFEVELTLKSVSVTNENSKVLTNLSNEVFNQLETTYTNY